MIRNCYWMLKDWLWAVWFFRGSVIKASIDTAIRRIDELSLLVVSRSYDADEYEMPDLISISDKLLRWRLELVEMRHLYKLQLHGHDERPPIALISDIAALTDMVGRVWKAVN